MILEIVETVGGFGALAVVAHKIEMAMLARYGYDTRDFFKPIRRESEPPPPVDQTMALIYEAQVRQEQRLYAACPSAFWLNPDGWDAPPRVHEHTWVEIQRIGKQTKQRCVDCGETAIEGMTAEHEAVLARHGVLVPKQTYRMTMPRDEDAPKCPVCHIGRRTVMSVHGGEATMWDCFDCGAEFTRKGETKSSKKRRQAKALTDQMRDLEAKMQRIDQGLEGYLDGMPPPPAV